jgi:hypothetical protein
MTRAAIPEAAFVGETFVGDAPTIADLKRLAEQVRRRGREERRAFRHIVPSPVEILSRLVYGFRWGVRFRLPSAALRCADGILAGLESGLLAMLGLRVGVIAPVRMRRVVRWVVLILVSLQIFLPSANEAMARLLVRAVIITTESVLHGDDYLARLVRRWHCARFRPVVDADGIVIGFVRPAGCTQDDRTGYRSMAVTPALANALAPAIESLEGSYRTAPSTIQGLNIRGWAAAARDAIWKWGRSSRGGSSPIETARKNVDGTPGSLSLPQKLASGALTIAWTTQLETEQARNLFVIENLPCARGAPGSEFGDAVAGGLCLLTLFGNANPPALSPAQKCVVAASYRRLVLVVGPATPADGQAAAETNNRGVIDRAARCLAAGNWSVAELQRHRQELESIAKTYPFNARPDQPGPADPVLRVSGRLPGARYLLDDQLKVERLAGGDGPLQLTLSSAKQNAAMTGAKRVLKSLAARTGSLCASDCTDPDTEVDAAVVLAEINDGDPKIVGGFATKHGLIVGRLRLVAGGYEPMPPTRAVGSLNKAPLALPIAQAGVTDLCNRTFNDIRNPGSAGDTGVTDCSQPGAMIPVETIFGRSLNLPPIDFVRERGSAWTLRFASQLGLTSKPGLDGDAALSGFVLGTDVVATPETMLRNFAAIYQGTVGRNPAARPARVVVGSANRAGVDLEKLGYDAKTFAGAAKLLRAPIRHPNGTLRPLGPMLARYGCDRAIAKSGTSESVQLSGEKHNRDKYILAAFRCAGRDFAIFGMIGSPNIATSIGSVASSDVVNLLEPFVAAALNGKGQTYAQR